MNRLFAILQISIKSLVFYFHHGKKPAKNTFRINLPEHYSEEDFTIECTRTTPQDDDPWPNYKEGAEVLYQAFKKLPLGLVSEFETLRKKEKAAAKKTGRYR